MIHRQADGSVSLKNIDCQIHPVHMFQAWTVLCTLVYTSSLVVRTLYMVDFADMRFYLECPFHIDCYKNPYPFPGQSLEIISHSNYFWFSRLYFFVVLWVLFKHKHTSSWYVLQSVYLWFILLCYVQLWGRQKAHTNWTSLIWKHEIWNALKSKTLWIPTWCHSGKFHSIKCLSWKKKDYTESFSGYRAYVKH